MTPDELRAFVEAAEKTRRVGLFTEVSENFYARAPDLALQLADAMEEIERAQIDGVVTDEGLFIRPEASMARLWALLADFQVLQQVIQALREE